jgi:hypothetical protein
MNERYLDDRTRGRGFYEAMACQDLLSPAPTRPSRWERITTLVRSIHGAHGNRSRTATRHKDTRALQAGTGVRR